MIGIVAPIIGGASLEMFGPTAAFGAVSLVLVLAALPLLGAPNVRIAREVAWKLTDIRRSLATFAAEGWTVAANIQVWQIVLFVTLSQSFAAYGGATALAALVGAFSGLFVGRAVDAGGGKRAAKIAVSAVAAVIVLRGLSLGHPALAVFAGAAGAFATLIYTPTLMTAMYNDSVSSPCPLRFQMATEGAFDVGCGACLILCAVTVALGGSLSVCVFFGLFGAAAIHLLLSRYYRDLSASATSASAL